MAEITLQNYSTIQNNLIASMQQQQIAMQGLDSAIAQRMGNQIIDFGSSVAASVLLKSSTKISIPNKLIPLFFGLPGLIFSIFDKKGKQKDKILKAYNANVKEFADNSEKFNALVIAENKRVSELGGTSIAVPEKDLNLSDVETGKIAVQGATAPTSSANSVFSTQNILIFLLAIVGLKLYNTKK